MMVQTRPAPRRGLWLIWFTLLGGNAAWTLHLLLSYFVVALACRSGPELPRFGGSGSLQLIVLLTLATSGLALGATIVGWRGWRRDGEERWRGFLALMGLLLGGLFLLTIFLQAIPLLFLDLCST